MKNILTIFTGGTICTTIKNGVMDTGSEAPAALIDLYKKSDSFCKDDVAIDPDKNFGILSENMTTDKWNEIAGHFLDNLKKFSGYDGIIIAHGTDSLAYTTSLFSFLLKGFNTPVFFVSSNRSILLESGLQNPDANGCNNFRAAVECIYRGILPGVYATYKNPSDGKMYLHSGAHLLQCRIYDENFYSRDAVDISTSTDFSSLGEENISLKNKMLINRLKNTKLNSCVLKINPYVGMNYDMFDLSNVKAVLHGTYHSGTACVVATEKNQDYSCSSSILNFFDRCAAANIPFYFSPSLVGEEFNVYASVPLIEHHSYNGQSPVFLYGDTEELIYTKLLFAYSVGLNADEISELLN